ncbi:MAG: DUF4350 domain-containing protein [Novosphingobium sp.]
MSAPNAPSASPFAPRAVLAMVVFGAAVFVALLYMIGSGMTGADTNNGGDHVGGKGLNGYAALALLLEKQGYDVHRAQTPSALDKPGLLILTPPANADGKEIAHIVDARRNIGPTLIITPKWLAMPARLINKSAPKGWVALDQIGPPNWPGFLDNVGVAVVKDASGQWVGHDLGGTLPDKNVIEVGKGRSLVPLVMTRGGHLLAAYVADQGYSPALDARSLDNYDSSDGDDDQIYPLVVVFEPDLLDNYGMADRNTALGALALVRAAAGDAGKSVTFDLTLPGFKRNANLLTLAFKPPFLAATLCLLLAALAVGWRAFQRFGPPTAPARAIAFGKTALVANSAGLIRRSRRLHLLGAPYAALVRDRLAHELALPRHADADATEAAIDRALAARSSGYSSDTPPFSLTAAQLRSARRPAELLRAGQALHALERMLTR